MVCLQVCCNALACCDQVVVEGSRSGHRMTRSVTAQDVATGRIGCDPELFEAFYREHVEAVQRFVARRVGDRELAADLTADIFVAAIESAHTTAQTVGPRWRGCSASRVSLCRLSGAAAAASGPRPAGSLVVGCLTRMTLAGLTSGWMPRRRAVACTRRWLTCPQVSGPCWSSSPSMGCRWVRRLLRSG